MKWIFSFLLSFSITFIAGFFIWSAFIDYPGNFVQQVLAQISINFFPASISTSTLQPIDFKQDEPDSTPITNSTTNTENTNTIVLAYEDEQDQLDDIQEKLDIIRQKIQALDVEQNKDDQLPEEDKEKIIDYPKILISEVEASGGLDDKEEFVELYNPNDYDVNLTNWRLQRKTSGSSSWSTYASSNLFLDKKISANGYFLISRTGYYYGYSDIFIDNPITDNNSFALENPNGDISDKLGFGSALDPELAPAINPIAGQSVGRKILSDGTEQDTDNNLVDFELQNLTPKSKNIAYSGPTIQIISSGGSFNNYPKILISEVQTSGIADAKEEFVELYNPSNQDIDLTGWYLQKKTSSGSISYFDKKSLFSGKTIPKNGYFLISRTGYFTDLKNISVDDALSDNSSLILSDPNDSISDEISWSEILKGLSFGRKWNLEDKTEEDFELQTPTPKSQNITYTESPAPTLQSIAITIPATKLIYTVGDILDITGLEITGTYSDGTTQVETIIADNITGFDSSVANSSEPLTITYNGQTTTYIIDVEDKIIQKNILINEIQINPISQRFIELYNPNDYEIDLTGWYIQRKTKTSSSWGSFVSATNFEGKIISANGYFLISRQIEGSDILFNITLSTDNSLVLKNSNRDIIDKVGWGEASDPEGTPATAIIDAKSIARIDGVDTDDNSKDFVILDTPTPKGP